LGACSAATERRKNSRRREPAASVCETREAEEGEMMITAAHYKDARQLLGWSRLAGEAGVGHFHSTPHELSALFGTAESSLASTYLASFRLAPL
jgi:hypothetical protein